MTDITEESGLAEQADNRRSIYWICVLALFTAAMAERKSVV